MDRYKFQPRDILDMGVTTVQNTRKILVQKGIKQVDSVIQGGHKTPFFVFPLTRYQDHMMREGHIHCARVGNASTWMQKVTFNCF